MWLASDAVEMKSDQDAITLHVSDIDVCAISPNRAVKSELANAALSYTDFITLPISSVSLSLSLFLPLFVCLSVRVFCLSHWCVQSGPEKYASIFRIIRQHKPLNSIKQANEARFFFINVEHKMSTRIYITWHYIFYA